MGAHQSAVTRAQLPAFAYPGCCQQTVTANLWSVFWDFWRQTWGSLCRSWHEVNFPSRAEPQTPTWTLMSEEERNTSVTQKKNPQPRTFGRTADFKLRPHEKLIKDQWRRGHKPKYTVQLRSGEWAWTPQTNKQTNKNVCMCLRDPLSPERRGLSAAFHNCDMLTLYFHIFPER